MSNLAALKTELLRPSVLKEGHLLKIGRKLKLPKLLYYVLKPCGIYCYGAQNYDIPQGYIALEPIEDISLSLGTVVEAGTRLYCIKISDKHKHHVLACLSIEIRNSWITAILTAVAQNLVYESESALRRRRDSSNSDEFENVFCEMQQYQFTSPFWASGEPKRKAKAKRLSLADIGVIQKPAWLTQGKKKNLRSKSLSCEDIHSICTVAETKTSMARKRSLHDLTRYFFSSNSNKSDNTETDYGEKLRADGRSKLASAGKKRWSLFPGMSSFGGSQTSLDIKSVTERKKMCTANGFGLGGSIDTKL